MLVATPGQATAYSTLHNSGNNTSTATGPLAKKSTLTSNTNTTASAGTPKSLIKNNSSTTSNTNNYSNHHQNHKNDNKNKTTSTISSKEVNSSATTHSLKTENSTKSTNFIQTLKDSVQKALISTIGNNSIIKHNTDNKLQNINNSTTNTTASLQNITVSTSSTNNGKAAPTTSSSIATNSATAASTSSSSSSSISLVRNKYSACSLSKLHTIAPTTLHRFPEDRQNASSTDSLQKEMCHFKPIRTAPTTPWKSGSKSRGNSLRFPKPYLATKKTEFILKSNCDVNNRKKKLQQIQNDHDGDDDDHNEDEQENKEYYGIYKPKPSLTFLSTSVTTPTHQSAFVCLVAQMKNLVNIQSKKKITSAKGGCLSSVVGTANLELTKTARTARPSKHCAATANAINSAKIANTMTSSSISNTPNKKTKSSIIAPIKEQCVRRKQNATNKPLLQEKKVDIPKDLVKTTRCTRRLTLSADKKKQHSSTPDIEGNVKRKSPKSADISKLYPATGITKAKSRRKLGSAKSKTNNIVQLNSSVAKDKLNITANAQGHPDAKEPAVKQQVNKRKRKITHEDEQLTEASPSNTCSTSKGKARKSSRLSKDYCANTKSSATVKKTQTANPSSNNKHLEQQRSALVFSPPLTRARLKHLNQEQQGKATTVGAKKRKA